MSQFDYNGPVPVTDEIIWVGIHDEAASVHCNSYLILDGEEAVLIDPGSIPHFPVVARKIIEVIDPHRISTIVVTHQDPDVCGNLPVMEDVIERSDLIIAAHPTTAWLIKYYGVKSQIVSAEDIGYRIITERGRILEFIPTPYLHSPGAAVLYDHKSHTLFSSDLFGGVDGAGGAAWSLFAPAHYHDLMAPWHQTTMPNNATLKRGMQILGQYHAQRICPQHGSVIDGVDNVQAAIDFLTDLPCGLDILE
ncbi:MBL fold metallo-hydrolase [Magnetofaba australis]|uniref:Putative histidine kinase n=1 Tax=Magnetofaba australis IT-1 TaxID=1434232 RepID=A0A1Y2K0F3_9PROT|nr:MBL fold metallo-hydrolase [Magnetofaba australis]OSM01510.1 putative histidine kinase [Magnetofaba australis IT-1]